AIERLQRPTGTAHLLAALLEDEQGIAASVLRKLGVNLPRLRKAADESPISETAEAERASGYGLLAYRAIQLAIAASVSLKNHYVGTEHLLLGLAEQQSSDAAQTLAAHGITRDRLFETTESLLAENVSQSFEKLLAAADGGAHARLSWQGQCQVWGEKPATVHITEIHGETMREVHLCDECDKEHGGGLV